MRKILLTLAALALVLFVAALLAWANRTSIAAHLISKQLHAPAKIATFDLTSHHAHLTQLWIGNPPRSRTKTAFTAQTIDVEASYSDLTGDPLTIQEIEVSQIFVGIEMYNGKESNWSRMAKPDKKPTKSSRDYLIKTLILNNLTVQVMQPDGSVKTYPTIPRMEFHNISSKTGFPIDEIEKAIFNLVIQDLFRRLNLDQLIDTLNPYPEASPLLKSIPKLFGN